MIFSGEDKELDAIRFAQMTVENTGAAHSVVAVSADELTVVPVAEAGARALETIWPVAIKGEWV